VGARPEKPAVQRGRVCGLMATSCSVSVGVPLRPRAGAILAARPCSQAARPGPAGVSAGPGPGRSGGGRRPGPGPSLGGEGEVGAELRLRDAASELRTLVRMCMCVRVCVYVYV
jgi:hypothetical protein